MTTYLEVHVIQNLPPSNINRDDTGAPKAAIYGGVNRLRVSSQAWKRAAREAFAEDISEAQRATRTKRVVRLLVDRIVASQPMEREVAAERAAAVLGAAGVKVSQPRTAKGVMPDPEDYEAEALFFVSNQQLDRLAELAIASEDGTVDKKLAKAAIDEAHGADIALFGRMVASSPDLNVDAAVQVAHAISTHAVDPQGDFYTAVDDAKPEDVDAGAGMMGTIEFSSATLYRYAAVGLELLAHNMGDDALAAEAVAAFVKGFTTSIPSGKKNSFAADTLPSAIVVMLRQGRPLSLVGAFERAVPASDQGYVETSVERMAAKARELGSTFGVEAQQTWVIAESALADALAPLGEITPLPTTLGAIRDGVTSVLSQATS